MAPCRLTAITPADLAQILSIENRSFPSPWNHNAFLEELACPTAYGYTARYVRNLSETDSTLTDGDLLGYIWYRIIIDEMHIFKVAVAPEWRRLGVASWILRRAMTAAEDKGAAAALLEVRASNAEALALYRKLGFNMIGRRKGYYSPPDEDGLMLKKQLKEER